LAATRALALGAALIAGLAGAARADDPTGWRLEGTTLRYDAQVEPPNPPAAQSVTIAPLVLLAQADFTDGRVPRRMVEDPGDLVWYYALGLPAGALDDKREVTFDDTHTLAGPRATLHAHGVTQVRARGRRAVLRTTVTFTGDPVTYWARSGQLVVERTFALREGRLEAAQFTLEVEMQTGSPPAVSRATWRGRITLKDELRVADRAFPAQVQAAIDKGVTWLRKATDAKLAQNRNVQAQGSQALGEVALPTFALLRSGVAPRELDHLFEWMVQQPFRSTYSVALYLMALEARSIQRVQLPPQAGLRSVARYDRRQPSPPDLELMRQALSWLLGTRKLKEGWWSYEGHVVEAGSQERREGTLPTGPLLPGGQAAPQGDRSNSQFAILALHSAMSAGIDVDGAVWEEIEDELVKSQEEHGPSVDLSATVYGGTAPLAFDPRDLSPGSTSERPRSALPPEERGTGPARGWDYGMARRPNDGQAYGSMTGAGISSMAAAREGLEATRHLTAARDRKALTAIRDGLAWFALHFDPSRNVGRNTAWYYYYLYSVEKAMDLSGVERVGDHEWWREGAAELLGRQQANGSWEGDVNETSFALLFLNRATLPAHIDVEVASRAVTGGGGPDPTAWDKVDVPGTGVVSLRQVLQALAAAAPQEVRERLALAQGGLERFDPIERPRLLPELIDLLASAQRSVAKWAKDTCKDLAGSDDPAALATFSRRWELLHQAWEARDASRVGDAQAVLTDVDAPVQLKRAALVAVDRLGAPEALGEVIALLEHRDEGLRTQAGQTLAALSHQSLPFDPGAAAAVRKRQADAWREWWAKDGPALVTAERARRAVADLGLPARAAQAEKDLRALGRPAVRALIDGLRPESSRARALKLLRELTGQSLPADAGAWLDWWEKQGGA
jgi:hypothetical protein